MMLFCVLVTALAGAATKHVSETVPVSTVVFAQYFIALLLILPGALRQGWRSLYTPRAGVHAIRGASGWLCFYFYYLAISKIPLVEASLLRAASPICVPVILLLMKTESFSAKRWWPVLVGLAGVSLILKPESGTISIWHLVGFMSAVTLALSMVLTRELALVEPGSRILFYYFLISLICSTPMMLLEWQQPNARELCWLLAIGGGVYWALKLYTEAYRLAKAAIVSPFSYFGVVFSGMLGWMVWGQIPDGWALMGICLVIAGGVWTVSLSN